MEAELYYHKNKDAIQASLTQEDEEEEEENINLSDFKNELADKSEKEQYEWLEKAYHAAAIENKSEANSNLLDLIKSGSLKKLNFEKIGGILQLKTDYGNFFLNVLNEIDVTQKQFDSMSTFMDNSGVSQKNEWLRQAKGKIEKKPLVKEKKLATNTAKKQQK